MAELRPLRAGELEEAWELDRECFHTPPERREAFLALDPARLVGAFEGVRLVGMVGVHALAQYFGGRAVPMGGVHTVAVAPHRRGEGLGRRLLAEALAGMRERGEALSTLFPATTRLYRAQGFELAGATVWRRIAPRDLDPLPRPAGARLREVAPAEIPRLAACHAELAAATNGFVARAPAFWETAGARHWPGRRIFAAEDARGRITGYAVYRALEGELGAIGGPFRIAVDEILWTERDAGLALWRLLGSWAPQVETIFWRGTAEDPLLLLLRDQELGFVAEVRWMSRLVDAAAAVAARGFADGLEAEAHLELADAALPANAGRWALRVAKGRGELVPGGRGDLRLDAGALAALFTGWATPDRLARAGRLAGEHRESRAALAAAFAGPTPWMPEMF